MGERYKNSFSASLFFCLEWWGGIRGPKSTIFWLCWGSGESFFWVALGFVVVASTQDVRGASVHHLATPLPSGRYLSQ